MSAAAASLEQDLAAAVQDGRIPHAVVCATNRDGTYVLKETSGTSNILSSNNTGPAKLTCSVPIGSFQYSHAVGKTSSDKSDAGDAKEIQEDAVFLLASQTKLLTAFAAMLVVERGLIGLDDDVAELLPELGGQKVLVGFEEDGEGKAILEERKGAITLRYVEDHFHQADYASLKGYY
jgi:hypothetical protein